MEPKKNPFAKLLQAELALFLPVLDGFFTALQTPGVNTQAVVDNFAKEQLALLQTLPAAESTGISTTAAAAQEQLHAVVNKLTENHPKADTDPVDPEPKAA